MVYINKESILQMFSFVIMGDDRQPLGETIACPEVRDECHEGELPQEHRANSDCTL
jgi:hypothetical protein